MNIFSFSLCAGWLFVLMGLPVPGTMSTVFWRSCLVIMLVLTLGYTVASCAHQTCDCGPKPVPAKTEKKNG